MSKARDAAARADELRSQLEYHGHRYYVLDDPELSDPDYDALLNVNCPAGELNGARACRLGKRIYRDQLELAEEQDGRRRYRIYGDTPGYERADGTDFAAIADGMIAVTPLHFDLTDQAGIEALSGFDLDGLMRPAAREV